MPSALSESGRAAPIHLVRLLSALRRNWAEAVQISAAVVRALCAPLAADLCDIGDLLRPAFARAWSPKPRGTPIPASFVGRSAVDRRQKSRRDPARRIGRRPAHRDRRESGRLHESAEFASCAAAVLTRAVWKTACPSGVRPGCRSWSATGKSSDRATTRACRRIQADHVRLRMLRWFCARLRRRVGLPNQGPAMTRSRFRSIETSP